MHSIFQLANEFIIVEQINMKISNFLKPSQIISDLKGSTKEEIITELITIFKEDVRVSNIDKMKEAVLDREKKMSTGVGKGFALPHGKTEAITEIIAAFGRVKQGIEYEALDHQPVYLVFLLVGKENLVGPHIKLLSRISRMMNKDEFREKLMQAEDADEIFSIFQEEENNYFDL